MKGFVPITEKKTVASFFYLRNKPKTTNGTVT